MTSFRFPLQRMLDWRRKQLELQEARFCQQTAAIAALDRARIELQAAALREETSLRAEPSPTGQDLGALSAFCLGVQKRERELLARKAACERQLQTQQTIMLEARRRCRLLERLKDRRLAEWQAAHDKEMDDVASELHLARRRS